MKKLLKGLLRLLRLMQLADTLRYYYIRIRNFRINRNFVRTHPEVALPPDYLMYEAFGLDYHRYYVNGKKSAAWVLEQVHPFFNPEQEKIPDWGCGPGGIIRYLPELTPTAEAWHGTDYNQQTIAWCQQSLPGIHFMLNGLNPPVSAPDAAYGLIYGISIFTHLSAPAHDLWLNELHRLLEPNGVLLLTLHGEAFAGRLGAAELGRFREGQLVVRGQVKEGHRTFIAYHPENWVRTWTSRFEVLRFIPGKVVSGTPEQDTWVLRKL